jgi:hypothetical protein
MDDREGRRTMGLRNGGAGSMAPLAGPCPGPMAETRPGTGQEVTGWRPRDGKWRNLRPGASRNGEPAMGVWKRVSGCIRRPWRREACRKGASKGHARRIRGVPQDVPQGVGWGNFRWRSPGNGDPTTPSVEPCVRMRHRSWAPSASARPKGMPRGSWQFGKILLGQSGGVRVRDRPARRICNVTHGIPCPDAAADPWRPGAHPHRKTRDAPRHRLRDFEESSRRSSTT